MYPYSKCNQVIGEEIPLKIDELYVDPSLPDLAFEEINATIRSGFLDFKFCFYSLVVFVSNFIAHN